jgi:hypothetical protein
VTTALPAAIDAVAHATLAAVRDGVQSAKSAVARALGPLLLEARRLGARLGAGTLQAIADVADAAAVRAKRSELFEALLLDAIASSLAAGYNFDDAARLAHWSERALCEVSDTCLATQTPMAPHVRALLLAEKTSCGAMHAWLERCGAHAGAAAAAVLSSFCP